MCGITGLAGFADPHQAGQRLQQMTNAIAHRGPDAEGHWVDTHVALGHRRLSIIDLSADGTQPFVDHTGRYALIFNGEAYNYQALREELKDYPFRTKTDTEVVLAGYLRWGKGVLDRLHGMFAFALWDQEKQTLLIARDRLGIKPMYYSFTSDGLVFGSELRALRASGLIGNAIRPQSLVDYMTYYTVHAPWTMVEGVMQLMPGQWAEWKPGGSWHTGMFWQAGETFSEPAPTTYDEAKTRVRALMRESVEKLLVSDVPLGAFLSGGIDSSAIVALMAEIATRPVETFSIGFAEKEFDESEHARHIADLYKTNHTAITLKPSDFLDALPAALTAMDMPSGDGVNTYVISGAIKKAGITVALSGLGGDELFAGYPVFKQWHSLHNRKALWAVPHSLRKAGAELAGMAMSGHKTDRLAELLAAPSSALSDTYPIFRKLIPQRDMEALAPGLPFGYNRVAEYLREREPALSKLPLLSQVSVAEITGYTQNVLLRDSDQFSMAHALELRVPFFEHPLVEYVLSIPDEFKYPTYPKKLLVEALHPLLPDEIVHRKKMGFAFPWDTWMRNELRDFCAEHMESLADRAPFDGAAVRNYWKRFEAKDPNVTWARVWLLVVLERWMRGL